MSFKLLKISKKSRARLGILKTGHGDIATPFFLPIATAGSVKSLDANDLRLLSAQVVLGNTYHLFLQPGRKVIARARGLHKFMNWPGPILTDSGGYQVFSLAKIRRITKSGVEFRSHLDGSKQFISPQISIKFQMILGSDIIMSFDECPPYPSKKEYYATSMDLTTKWAMVGKKVWQKKKSKSLLFGIIQGGIYRDLRIKHAKEMLALDLSGYALGGLAVGESSKKMYQVVDWCEPYLPKDKPRYLMGTGYPEQLVEVVKRGIDMFDCVIPTREARHGRLYLWDKKYKRGNFSNFYKTISITNARFKTDMSPIDETGRNKFLVGYSKAYLNHLFKAKEPLAIRLATLNNLGFYLQLMEDIRNAIREDKF